MRNRPRIYTVLNFGVRYSRVVNQGISDYFFEKASEFELVMVLGDNLQDLERPKGLIATLTDRDEISLLRSRRFPVVNISSYLDSPNIPSVISDNIMSGRMAAEHLLARKFHHFAYYGLEMNHTLTRAEGFEQRIHIAGLQCSKHFHTWRYDIQKLDPHQQRELRKSLRNLPKPVGIFCGQDRDAWEISHACDALGFAIGKEVGIVGCGNDEFFCQTRHPHLSSVENNPYKIGYEAAALLVRLIKGKPAPKRPILIPPLGVIIRGSSDVLVTEDPHVARAVHFIREHINQPLQIQDVLNQVPLSRDTLERRFRKHLDHTVLETIHLLKIDHIKHLLISTSKSIEEIATECGFSSSPYMAALFREKAGTSPSEYRASFQLSHKNTVTK